MSMPPLRFTRFSVLFAAATFVTAVFRTEAAPSVETRSEASTEGERRLLEPDKNRTFQPEMARFGSRTAPDTKGVSAATYNQTKEFGSSKEFAAKKFSASEFLPSSNQTATKSFVPPSGPANTQSFSTDKNGFATKSFEAPSPQLSEKSFTTKTAKDANQAAGGAEAARMKENYTPANPPHGGVTTGHRLTIEEVKDILNKSK